MSMNDVEIKAAITKYINDQGMSIRDKEVNVKIKAGRKGNGVSAEIEIIDKPTVGVHDRGMIPSLEELTK